MLHVAKLVLVNWMVFRGEHVLDFGPTAYGVFAHRTNDPESSNWSGKSSILEAIEFCLGGWQNKHRRHGAAGWISEGEKSGGVRLVLSDGTRVARTRDKKTTLDVTLPGMSTSLVNDDAQLYLDGLLGLSREDRMASCFLQQREAARLVLADPSERMAVIASWTRLDRLDAAHGIAAEKLDAERVHERERTEKRRVAEEVGRQALDGQTEEQLAGRVAELDEDVVGLDEDVAGLVARVDLARRLESLLAVVPEYDALVAEGKRIAAVLKSKDLDKLRLQHEAAQGEELEAATAWKAAASDSEQKRKLSQGQFDGRCPVAEMQCPVAEKINAGRKRSLELYRATVDAVRSANAEYERAGDAERSALAHRQEAERLEERVRVMREQERRMRPAYDQARAAGEPEDAGALEEQARAARSRRAELGAQRAAVASRLERAQRARRQVEELQPGARLVVLREAESLLSQARRRVAEGAVSEIEAGANGVLLGAGIDLGVSVSWQREGNDPARRCEACGWAYPSSARVKACGECGEARGRHQVSKLEVDLTRRSGAAEDLGGIALRLAASEWLRRDRASAWASASLDEPFSQADAANRRALGAKLWPMLRAAGFAQAFISSHTHDVLNALPARIDIECDGKWSSVKVT